MPPNRKPRTLYDHAGRPVRIGALRRDTMQTGQTGTRGYWHESFYRYINPAYMAWILYEARSGTQLDRFLSLAEEMEEVDPHYAGVLRARKRATTKLPLTVDPNGAKADIVTAVEKLIQEPLLRGALTDMLDGLGKGFSLTEIMWQSAPTGWEPRALKWRDPRYFGFDPNDRTTVQLRIDASKPEALPPFKWVYHQPKLKSGLPARNGLARLCAWTWLYKTYTVKDWMNFLQTYGMPIRVGKYGPQADRDDIDVLLEQVLNIGQDAAAVIPESANIEFAQVKGAAGQASVFEGAARYFDEQLSKAITGATMTSDSGSSLAQAKVHQSVSHDITEGDAEDLGTAISEQYVQAWVQLNFGEQERYPLARFELPERPGENVDDPDMPAGAGGKGEGGAGGKKPADDAMNTIRQRVRQLGLNAVGAGVGDELDALAVEYLRGWREQLAPMKDDLDELANSVNTYDEFKAGLGGLYGRWAERDATFIDALGEAGFLAAGIGSSE